MNTFFKFLKNIFIWIFKDWKHVVIASLLIALVTLSLKYKNLKNDFNDIQNTAQDTLTVYKNKVGELYSQQKVYITEINDLKKSNSELYDEVKNLNDNPVVVTKVQTVTEFKDKSTSSTKTIIDNFKSNEEATNNWADNLGKLQGKISDEFLQYIADMGPQAAGYVQDMANMTDKELKQCEKYWEDTNENIKRGVDNGFGEAEKKVEQKLGEIESAFANNIDKDKVYGYGDSLGSSFGQGAANGIEAQRANMIAKARSVARAAAESAKQELKINSPSRVTMEIGKYFGEGLALGIEGQQTEVEVSSRKLSQKAIEGLSGINSSITKINSTNFSPKSSVIDYDKLSNSMVNSMQGLEFQVGKDGLVRLVGDCLRRAVRI